MAEKEAENSKVFLGFIVGLLLGAAGFIAYNSVIENPNLIAKTIVATEERLESQGQEKAKLASGLVTELTASIIAIETDDGQSEEPITIKFSVDLKTAVSRLSDADEPERISVNLVEINLGDFVTVAASSAIDPASIIYAREIIIH